MSQLMKKAGFVFNENKVKPYLKMSIQRLQLLINKKANQIKISKKEIARLLAEGREEKARIRVEQVIREDFTAEAYDILELHCELVAGRIRFLASQKTCPEDMEQAVCTIIWAADRAEVSELSTVKAQFTKKYGGEFVRRAEQNEDCCVNQKVTEKLGCDPPSAYVVTEYLLGIAKEYGVDYTPAIPLHGASYGVDKSPAAADTGPQAASGPPSPPTGSNFSPPGGRGGNSSGEGGSGSGGGGGGGGGGVPTGIASPPPVTAWAVPNPVMPQAYATETTEPLHGGHPPSVWGGKNDGRGAGHIPESGSYTLPDPSSGKGARVDPVGPPGQYVAGSTGEARRGSGGWEEATKGWGPSQHAHGRIGERKHDGEVEGAGKTDDPPPPYTPYDIPSPPKNKPVSTRTFDIPAAPGYEDSPPQSASASRKPYDDVRAHIPSAPGTDDDAPNERGGDAASGGEANLDDLEARFKNLRRL